MEEKKFDINSIIGFILLFGIMIWYFYQNQPTPEELEAQKQAEIEKVETENNQNLKRFLKRSFSAVPVLIKMLTSGQ